MIDCEMNAWARSQYRTCERVVTGFKNELSCQMLPPGCRVAYPSLVNNYCNQQNYWEQDRWRYNSSPRGAAPVSSLLLALMVILVGLAGGFSGLSTRS
jgi:hypothetical protein